MEYKEIIDKLKPQLDQTIEYYKGELAKIRVGRANPTMVEDIKVDCYGQKFPLKQLANINIPQPRVIIIQPWDKNILGEIRSAIEAYSSGLNPIIDGETIRINIPQLSEERRKELIKVLSQKTEEARISIRRRREEAWKEIQELEQQKEITEDEKYRAKDELQKLIDEYNKKINELEKNKEQDILTI